MTLIRSIPRTLIIIIITFILLALAWNAFVPAYENLDEMEHTEVIRYIAVIGQLPVHSEAEVAGFHVRQEASQPPLYHLLGALWMHLWQLPQGGPEAQSAPGAVVACGDLETLYNKATWYRDPYADEIFSAGHRRTVHSLRLLSTFLQVGTLVGTWCLARRLFTERLAALATSIVAFDPQFLLVSADVNNDNLVTPLATWGLFVLLTIWQSDRQSLPTFKQLLLLGTLSGLAGLSKLSGLGLLACSGLVLLMLAIRCQVTFRTLLRWWILVSLPAIILMAPWFLRNVRLYGDPTALTPMLAKVGRRGSPIHPFNEFHLMWRSYWGQIPCTFYPRSLYWPWMLLSGVGLLSGMFSYCRLTQNQREGVLGLISWFLVITAAWIRWDMLTPAPGGRLLFPAASAVGVVIAVGWEHLGRSIRRPDLPFKFWLIGLPLLALITLRASLFPVFVPPGQVEEHVIPVEQRSDYTFGDKIALRGYSVRLTRSFLACGLVRSSYCRPTLAITLYWQAIAPIKKNDVMVLQLVALRPGDNTLRYSYNRWPGRGTLPTSAWPVGSIIKDTYRLPLPPTEHVTQAWGVRLGFFDPETKQRLTVRQDGGEVGSLVLLNKIRVSGNEPQCEEEYKVGPEVLLDDVIALTHAHVETDTMPWQITLCWESKVSVHEDYTVFVHAYDKVGNLLGTGDAPPMNQAFPTSYWHPEDRIRDAHVLSLDRAQAQRVVVGLYHPETGARLPAMQAGERLPDDAVVIWRRHEP